MQEKLLKFAERVRSIPPKVWEDISIKRDNDIREVAELLCGALWHLDYALALGELDSTPVKERAKHPSFWQEWLETGKARCKPASLVQDMLISDACLRLAGALDRPQIKNQFLNPEDIAKKYLGGCADAFDQAMIRLIIHRDSFMHIEIPSKTKKWRCKAREQEMLAETYNIAQLFDDCLVVGCTLAEKLSR